ncbi:MAG TPA: accessory factor UbiK family protein [Geminicoccaceae bacterium]|nr:accessory factor UbiK family protein [Geminicoccaceae bacterium]
MQTENRLLDDLARMANGALNTLSGVREEIESRVRERVERMLADMDMVPREEFEAVRAMAQTARTEQEDLAGRVAELERRLSGLSGTVQPAAAKSASAKPAAARSAAPKKPKPAVTRSRSGGAKTAAKPTSE